MTDKVQKIREEVKRLTNELIQEKEKGFGSDTDDACILELQNVLTYIDSLQEEPASDELEEAAQEYVTKEGYLAGLHYNSMVRSFKAGAEWQKEMLINKACEYLKDNIWRNLYFVNGEAGFPTAEFIKGFRKSMEE